ncbi:MAG: hypothetical protein IM568_11490 [Flavobacterium sp.]|nr:hypothetical protein [Flavobacterium sp.]
MILVVLKYLIPRGFNSIAVFPFVFLKFKESKNDLVLLNHEKIHLRQQLELLIVPFFISYGLEFVIRFFQYRDWKIAYKNISFEREAYENEKDLNFLDNRVLLNHLKFIKK